MRLGKSAVQQLQPPKTCMQFFRLPSCKCIMPHNDQPAGLDPNRGIVVSLGMEGSIAGCRQLAEIRPVVAVLQLPGAARQIVGGEPAFAKGDLFEAGDLQSLTALQRGDEVGRIEEGAECPGVEPGESAPQLLDVEPAQFQIAAVGEQLLQS